MSAGMATISEMNAPARAIDSATVSAQLLCERKGKEAWAVVFRSLQAQGVRVSI